jgi:hypothetical protein
MNAHDSLIAEAAERGRAGVQALAANLLRLHADDCRAVSDELAAGQSLPPYERQQLQQHLLHLQAEFASRMAVLDELSATYDALDANNAQADPRTEMAIAIELAQCSLRLQKLFHEIQAADADRLFV